MNNQIQKIDIFASNRHNTMAHATRIIEDDSNKAFCENFSRREDSHDSHSPSHVSRIASRIKLPIRLTPKFSPIIYRSKIREITGTKKSRTCVSSGSGSFTVPNANSPVTQVSFFDMSSPRRFCEVIFSSCSADKKRVASLSIFYLSYPSSIIFPDCRTVYQKDCSQLQAFVSGGTD